MRAAGQPVRVKTPLEKLAAKPLSLRLAASARCYQCEGEDADPAVKWRIGNCTNDVCALHAVRPYQYMHGRPLPASLRATSHQPPTPDQE